MIDKVDKRILNILNNKSDNILFIWIPKTAGTSFYNVLNQSAGMMLLTENYHRFDNFGNVTFGHACIYKLMEAGIVKPEYYKRAEVITVVRNPIDRFVSLYNDYKRTGRIPPNFSQWQFANTLRNVTRKPGLYNSIDFSMCADQSDWIIPGSKIIYLEDLDQYCKNYFNSDLPTLNCSEENEFDDECRSLIYEIYNKDFCLLNY